MQQLWKAALSCMGVVSPTGVGMAEKLQDALLCLVLLLILLRLALAALFGVQIFSAGIILQESFTILSP